MDQNSFEEVMGPGAYSALMDILDNFANMLRHSMSVILTAWANSPANDDKPVGWKSGILEAASIINSPLKNDSETLSEESATLLTSSESPS